MKLNIPFYKQTSRMNCGSINLKIAFSYFGKERSIEEIEKQVGVKEDKGASTIRLAIAARCFGHRTCFFSKHLITNQENFNLEYYKDYTDDLKEQGDLVKKAKALGVEVGERGISLKELLSYVTTTSLPIVLIDWNTLAKEEDKGYLGHFAPVVGYSDKSVYIHNVGLNATKAFLKVDKNLFDKARKAKGTDEDVLVIFKEA